MPNYSRFNSSIPPQDLHPHKWDYCPCFKCSHEVTVDPDMKLDEDGNPICEECAEELSEEEEPSEFEPHDDNCDCYACIFAA